MAKVKVRSRADPYAAEVTSAVRQKFRPQQQEVAGDLRVSQTMDRNIHGWYQNYLNQVEASRRADAAGYQDAATKISQIADTSTNVDRSNRQALMAKLYTDAGNRGASVDGSLEATAAQAEAARRTGLDEAQAATLRTGANQNAYLADRGRIGAGAEIGAHQAEAGRRTVLRQKRADLKLQAADYGVSVRSSLKSAQANQDLAQASLGLKAGALKVSAQKANESARHNLILEGISSGRLKLDGTKFQNAAEKDRYQRAHRLGSYRPAAGKATGPTRSQRITAQNEFDKARTLLAGGVDASGQSERHILSRLVSKGIPADIARAAYQRHWLGGVKPALRRRLINKYGLKTPRARAPRIGSGLAEGSAAVGVTVGGISDYIDSLPPVAGPGP